MSKLNKDFAVFGLGKFGSAVARNLMALDRNVVGVDRNDARVQELASELTYAVRADVTNPEAIRNIGVKNLDVVVIAVSSSVEDSVMATLIAKEMGVKTVISKATSELHRKILEKIGADIVIFPEQDMGTRLARKLVGGSFQDMVELSTDISIIEIAVKKEWIGKTLKDINVRRRYGANVIAIKKDDDLNVNPNPDEPLLEEETLVIIGRNEDLKVLAQNI